MRIGVVIIAGSMIGSKVMDGMERKWEQIQRGCKLETNIEGRETKPRKY
jgi:hypothetical protein